MPKIKTDRGNSKSLIFPIKMDVNSELNRTKMALIVNTKTKRIAVKRPLIVFMLSVSIKSPSTLSSGTHTENQNAGTT